MAETIHIGEQTVAPGERRRIELPVARLFTGNWLRLPVEALNGRRQGPRLWLDAALHGDELNGMETIRRVLEILDPALMAGSVLAVPVVNVFGFIEQTRYLPDRRDLNRSFPGSTRGSLSARIAHLFMTEIVARCQYGLDLHTGSLHRTNLPQIRGALSRPATRRLADAFAAPLMFEASPIRGTLRAAAERRGVPVLVYEAGEPLRFDDEAIRVGVGGVLRVLADLGIWRGEAPKGEGPTIIASETRWLRASRSGIFRLATSLGARVHRRQVLGEISGLFSNGARVVRAPADGTIIGYTNNPLVHQGSALIHLGMD